MKKTIIAALALTLMASTAMAEGTFDDGVAAFDRGDHAEAVGHFRVCADDGDRYCQSMLGLMYAKGQGVPQDYVLAHMWYNLAAAQGHEDAAEWRDIVAKRMTPAQIAKAQDMAREWRPKQ